MKVMIIGAGKLGRKLASAMLNGEIEVTIIDQNASLLEHLVGHIDVLTVHASGTDVAVLEELNIASYDLTIAVTGNDDTNVLISSLAKKLGCKRTVARIRNPEYSKQLEFMKDMYNIDHVINPEQATANEMLRYLMESYTFFFGDYGKGRVSVVNINIKNLPDFNKSISELKYFDELVIVAISRNGDIIIPNGSTVLEENDILYLMGKKEKIKVIGDIMKKNIETKPIKKVMILGGSMISYYLANALAPKGIKVKIIESDLERCKELSKQLPENTLVIHGQGIDVDLLEEENIDDYDAFIGCTGYDEENIFSSLMAKQHNIPKVIAKISRESYVHIIEKLGIDMTINPMNITASNILKYIRGGKVVSVSLLLDGQAEVTEIIASEKLEILNKPLKKLNLPKSIIIGAIVHGSEVIIPNGDSKIHAGDRFVVFSLLSEVPALEKFFKLKDGR